MIALSKNTAAACFQHVQPKSIHTTVLRHQTFTHRLQIHSFALVQKQRRFQPVPATRVTVTGGDSSAPSGRFHESKSGFDRSTEVGNWRLRPLGWWQFSIKKRLAASLCLWKLRLGRKWWISRMLEMYLPCCTKEPVGGLYSYLHWY